MAAQARTALVTGCSSPNGIGANTAMALANRGYLVFATAKSLEDLGHLEGKCEPIVLADVTDEESIKKAVETVSAKTGGRLDVLVNNAGVDMFSPLLDIDIGALRHVLDINAIGPIAVTQAFSPLLVRAANEPSSGSPAGSGIRKSVILNMGSMAKIGVPWKGAYCASKAALECFSGVLRMEMAGLNVRVINCHVGSVKTDMFDNGKLFPTMSPSPSQTPFYKEIFPTIKARIEKDSLAQAPFSADPVKVGADIASRIDQADPPKNMRTGTAVYGMDLLVWSLSWFGLTDWLWGRMFYTWMVGKPLSETKKNA